MATATQASTLEAPRGGEVVLEVIEAERKKIEAWYQDQVRRLDRAATAFGGTATASTSPAPATATRSKPQQRQRAKITSPKPGDFVKRCEEVHRWMAEVGRPVPVGEVRRELDLTESTAKSAVLALEKKGQVRRSGEGAATKYEVIGAASPAPSPTSSSPPAPSPAASPPTPKGHAEGTPQGRLLARVIGTGGATLADLAQFCGIPEEEARSELGVLIREEEVERARHNGVSVYVPGRDV